MQSLTKGGSTCQKHNKRAQDVSIKAVPKVSNLVESKCARSTEEAQDVSIKAVSKVLNLVEPKCAGSTEEAQDVSIKAVARVLNLVESRCVGSTEEAVWIRSEIIASPLHMRDKFTSYWTLGVNLPLTPLTTISNTKHRPRLRLCRKDLEHQLLSNVNFGVEVEPITFC